MENPATEVQIANRKRPVGGDRSAGMLKGKTRKLGGAGNQRAIPHSANLKLNSSLGLRPPPPSNPPRFRPQALLWLLSSSYSSLQKCSSLASPLHPLFCLRCLVQFSSSCYPQLFVVSVNRNRAFFDFDLTAISADFLPSRLRPQFPNFLPFFGYAVLFLTRCRISRHATRRHTRF